MKTPLKKNIILSLCTVFVVTGLVCCKGLSFSNDLAANPSEESRLPANDKKLDSNALTSELNTPVKFTDHGPF